MTNAPAPPDAAALLLSLDGCHTFRAVTGWRERNGGKLKAGRLFRSDGLDQLSDADHALVAGLGIDHVLDLRASAEIERSRWPDGMEPRIWAGAESAAEADITSLMQRDGLDDDAGTTLVHCTAGKDRTERPALPVRWPRWLAFTPIIFMPPHG